MSTDTFILKSKGYQVVEHYFDDKTSEEEMEATTDNTEEMAQVPKKRGRPPLKKKRKTVQEPVEQPVEEPVEEPVSPKVEEEAPQTEHLPLKKRGRKPKPKSEEVEEEAENGENGDEAVEAEAGEAGADPQDPQEQGGAEFVTVVAVGDDPPGQDETAMPTLEREQPPQGEEGEGGTESLVERIAYAANDEEEDDGEDEEEEEQHFTEIEVLPSGTSKTVMRRLKYECSQCSASFPTADQYMNHFSEDHRGEKAFECHLCHSEFDIEPQLRNHMQKKHPDGKLSVNQVFPPKRRVMPDSAAAAAAPKKTAARRRQPATATRRVRHVSPPPPQTMPALHEDIVRPGEPLRWGEKPKDSLFCKHCGKFFISIMVLNMHKKNKHGLMERLPGGGRVKKGEQQAQPARSPLAGKMMVCENCEKRFYCRPNYESPDTAVFCNSCRSNVL